ncbi:MAG: hypothetical protein EOO23_06035 [Comamonadaceae bacterium]|nr:MAG: hypothetical protein EOO23_06035 [Comamonadaceae bacterium]
MKSAKQSEMNKTEAAKLASDFALQQGYDVHQYSLRVTKRIGEWEVYFQRKSAAKPQPGDFFSIYVDERSKTVNRIVHGK